jgi:hypothetical protein
LRPVTSIDFLEWSAAPRAFTNSWFVFFVDFLFSQGLIRHQNEVTSGTRFDASFFSSSR